ncbi:hypoxanthine phosphoribosyltransferase [Geitlerinema calcuttense]|uniref:Hypoxanthine phosphoribosyltransferase n=1 Tax=Geitlerinema calcuttense NRMC-F 0142 TaxID=2922238 RepID=A0ABT7M272_9CYAN|nr:MULTISPECIES: hypoxanthine phosphoribosyltransferase [Cyanophyceae]MDL5054221.1 hypoxanthine phosphoribosyltransferase [Oscillatoria laete-virens NRMC-F 0139]MDL5057470.1 hypoxanthine phosphoribosyltransferase [Geitlerinema calcuttense NRMC-F 0142]
MLEDIDQILFPEKDILAAVSSMGEAIEKEYKGQKLTVVSILNGSVMFFTDLIRRIHMPLRIECIYAQSYQGGLKSSGEVTIFANDSFDVRGADILIIDDILDTGLTLSKVREELSIRGAREIKTAVLLRKNVERVRHVEADFVGFDIPDRFIVGYGLDYKDSIATSPSSRHSRIQQSKNTPESNCDRGKVSLFAPFTFVFHSPPPISCVKA